ncbi:MAG TPA: UDP-N-acetylglucosamine 2-epimerase (non-hydrolyzing) [Balneola sp.]|nr:UDP-N-acetylglucosamine 2-epimerase (non-hydrolyzing) [Balneola sp.]MAO77137.1 UDP-N-acetylglucosamine 2-epimerase (non-hydrolyzing) [Balneola sp.]MBF63414.1 UDP-N-acetylglucosamine 2-epimerase (non-hydrolyzing) [Balneola sp.]HAH50518.1 UDP-N-acetylglucosamine 2-epimerase (non-hydrolyzing) [Balneola sp.]HAW80170.1 UDP-N-acetylglucosamine 2-epimerase (non-hydrolyzing) [Balneola sp.]
MKIATVIGARPQFIKASTVSRVIKYSPHIQEFIIHTGQHFDSNMSEVFFNEMDIPKPAFNLNINSVSHGVMTARMLEGIEEILLNEQPDLMIVYGDTNSTLAGALAAVKLHIPVVHIESGLRSYNLEMPEEYNRIITDRVSKVLFVPNQTGFDNLISEGFENFDCEIINSGDVMLDATLHYSKMESLVSKNVKQKIDTEEDYILATIHRQENTNDINHLKNIINALNELHETYNLIVPLHPRTKQIIQRENLDVNFNVFDSLGYIDMMYLIKNCSLVITDSGGLQKEAYFLKKYCLTLRSETEWVELVNHGFNFIIDKDFDLLRVLTKQYFGKKIKENLNFYGDGKSAETIVSSINRIFNK